jgi:DNA end-binding protein Ku
VVIRTRQHLAAVKPQEHGLILELMHFPQEILDASEFKSPVEKAPSKPEMTMARQLISSMTDKWKPEQYTDEYRDALEKMIEDKLEHGEKTATPSKSRAKPTNVIDLVSVLQQSIEKTSGRAAATRKTGKKSRPTKARKKAA